MSKLSTHSKLNWFSSVSLGILSLFVTFLPVEAAEKIYFSYNSWRLSLEITSLETFVKEGKINKELEFYLRDVSPEDRVKFREALIRSYHFNPVQLYRFFHTPTGETILNDLGNLMQIQGGKNGKFAIRGALIEAANSPQGLSVLNFLRKFPTNIEFDTNAILKIVDEIDKLVKANKIIVNALDTLSEQESLQEPFLDFSTFPDIRKPGKYSPQYRRLNLEDPSRNRKFYVDLYAPNPWPNQKVSVIIISHGLASRPEDYDSLAKHLASYGYLVALPQHPGSDFLQVKGMLEGYSKQLFSIHEFIDRPLDITYLLNQLEQLNQKDFQGKLNLDSVGAIGHSLGGYTVLALAGAKIDFNYLKKECYRPLWFTNLSLLIQCQGLDLPPNSYSLRDPRIKAVVATNPMNSGLFGSQGLEFINIPVFIIAGSQDPATPLVLEQGQAFMNLTTPDKYLGLVKGQAHLNFSKLDAGTQALIKSFADLTIADQGLIDKYDNALILAFFEIYLQQNQDYKVYLQASYADYISQKPFEFYLINNSSASAFKKIWQRLKF